MRTTLLTLSLITASTFLVGCGDDNGNDFSLSGVYTITAWTENDMSCDQEGPSVLENESDTRFIATQLTDPLTSRQVVVAGPCSDPQTCSDNASGGYLAALAGLYPFDPGTVPGENWATSGASSFGPDQDNQCSGSVTRARLMAGAMEGEIRLEIQTLRDEMFPATEDENGELECDLDALQERAAELPCVGYSTITANNPESVPPAQN